MRGSGIDPSLSREWSEEVLRKQAFSQDGEPARQRMGQRDQGYGVCEKGDKFTLGVSELEEERV